MSEVNQNPEEVTENPTVEEPVNNPEVKTVTMTQEELNALISKEKGRVKSKYADYDEIKTKASEYEKALEEKRLAELSAQERAEELAKKFEAERNDYAKQLEEFKVKVERQQIVNEFIKAAPGVNIPSDRIDAALKLADLSAVTVGENGVEGLETVMGALVEQYSFLADVKKPQKPIGESTNSPTDTLEKSNEQLLRDAADKAKRTGKTEDMIAYATLKAKLGK
jgi:hypothetical protein